MSAGITKSGSNLDISVNGFFGGGLVSALTGNVPFGGEPVHYDYHFSLSLGLGGSIDYNFHVVLDIPETNKLHVLITGDSSIDCNLTK